MQMAKMCPLKAKTKQKKTAVEIKNPETRGPGVHERGGE